MVRNRPVAPLRAVPVSRQSISFRSHGLQAAARASPYPTPPLGKLVNGTLD